MKRRTLAVLLFLLAAWASPADPVSRLSDEQEQRLQRGEIVVLNVLPPGGPAKGAQGGTALTVVNASPERVWEVLVDYPRHSGLYPKVTTAEVLERDPDHALVRYVVGVGPFSFGFHVDNYPDPDRLRLEWRLAQGHSNGLFRENWGYWQVEAKGDTTLLTYSMAAHLALPAFMTRGAQRDGLVEAVKAVRERAERAS
jgi:ribosome-associated toxin RatA of RatAB toxin-antitoxin module